MPKIDTPPEVMHASFTQMIQEMCKGHEKKCPARTEQVKEASLSTFSLNIKTLTDRHSELDPEEQIVDQHCLHL